MSCKVIAHRGSNKVAPQNTLPAFKQAIAEGTDGFETDVHLTKDGKLVICHNYSVDDTSDGRGDITSYTLKELKTLDFGSYFSTEYIGTPLPTLEEFLELVAPANAEIINIELKRPKDNNIDIVRKTLSMIKQYGVLDRVIISGFNPRLLKAVKDFEPRCKTGFLYPTLDLATHRLELIPFLTAKRIGADYIHPYSACVSKGIVKQAHRLGLKVNVWTVNDEATVKKLLDMGVDGIITDCPGKVKQYIANHTKDNVFA